MTVQVYRKIHESSGSKVYSVGQGIYCYNAIKNQLAKKKK